MKARYSIAMVAPGPFPAPRGSQVLVRELAEALGALGHSVHVIAYGAGDGAMSAPGVQVHRTPALLGGANAFGPHPWRIVVDLIMLGTLYSVVRAHAVDVIHAHNYEAPTLAYAIRALLGVPVVYHAHNLMRDELAYYFGRPVLRRMAQLLGGVLDRVVPRRADCVVALSQAMADELHANGVARECIEVIPPGIFTGRELVDGGGADPYPGAKVIVYAGNLDPYQDVPTLIRAMVEVRRDEPEALLVIVTHSTDPAVEKSIRALDLADEVRVVIANGYAPVQSLLRRADVLVCPRTSPSGFPIKLLNYMAAARPIVVSAAAARALGDGPWIVVADADAGALARGIVSALRDPTLQGRIGGAVQRQIHEVYDWALLAPRVEAIYGRLVAASAGTGRNCGQLRKSLAKSTALRVDGADKRS